MKEELADECNYTREAACMRSFGNYERLGGDARFKVPWVWEGSTDRVLVMEHVGGTSVGDDAIFRLPQADRNEVRVFLATVPKGLFEADTVYRGTRRSRRG